MGRGPKFQNKDLEGCEDVQKLSLNTGLQCFQLIFLLATHKPLQRDTSKTHLHEIADNGLWEKSP